MATLPAAPNGAKKLSFAKVAASASKEQTSISNARPFASGSERRDQKLVSTTTSSTDRLTDVTNGAVQPMRPTETAAACTAEKTAGPGPCEKETQNDDKVVEGLKDLKLEIKMPSLVVNGSGSTTTERSSKAGNSQTPSDDNSQRADSNSELGTKPPSLDGKSITSGTTFALDEKESLRPDDSASVKAAAEDDDAFSIRGSLIAGSRMGSEVAARIHRIQLGDMPPRTITTLVSTQSQGLATPQSGASEKPPVADPNLPLDMASTGADGLNSSGLYSQNPDEKLLEAMQVPKDRFFLLKLEHQVIEFVQDSKEPFMDLPPSNSFCRMLTHKLADYYHMTHSFEPVPGAVRIYRTPFCRIPQSLSSMSVQTPNTNSPAPVLQPRKIMRRGQDGEFALASANPSKPTSEAGSDSKEKGALGKEKLTREEREEAYNRVRERIFGANAEKTEASTPEGEDSNGVSRASSVSAKDKSNATGKRRPPKGKRDDSEGFDTRSSYMVINGVQQTWGPSSQQYFHVSNPPVYNGQFSQPFPGTVQPGYGPNQSCPQMMPQTTAFGPQYNSVPPYPPQPMAQPALQPPLQASQQQRFQPPTPPIAMSYNASLPNVPQPGWQAQQNNFSQNQYPAGRAPPTQPVGPAGGVPYAYGQLPVNTNPLDPKTQHPIPGSYSRPSFNPKTQSFVPASGMATIQSPAPYGNSTTHPGSPQFGSPLLNYNGYPPPLPQTGSYAGNGAGYGMTRQGSNSSIPPYHPAQQVQQAPAPMAPSFVPPQKHLLPNSPPHIPSKPAVAQAHGQQQNYSTLSNYGNPATLPQKPPT